MDVPQFSHSPSRRAQSAAAKDDQSHVQRTTFCFDGNMLMAWMSAPVIGTVERRPPIGADQLSMRRARDQRSRENLTAEARQRFCKRQ